MADVILTSDLNSTTFAAATNYHYLTAGDNLETGTEADWQITSRTAGTLSKLWIFIGTNTNDTAATFRTRVNGANGNISVSIGAGVTGEFEDTINTDSITTADEINFQSVTSGSVFMIIKSTRIIWSATTNTVYFYTVGNTRLFSTASVTRYLVICGNIFSEQSSETNMFTEMNLAGTLKNMFVTISSNARTTDTSFRVRKNTANGNEVITVGSTATGFFEDTTNTDSIADGDDVNLSLTTGTGTETIVIQTLKTEFETTDNNTLITGGHSAGQAHVAGSTDYNTLCTNRQTSLLEDEVATDAGIINRDFKNASIVVSANGTTASSTHKFRKNAADGNISISIGSGSTGLFEDNTNTDSISATSDEINYQLIVGTGGTLTVRTVSIRVDQTGVVVRTYYEMLVNQSAII